MDWRVTATTIFCDAVEDEVTLLVFKDGTARCTGLKKYAQPTAETERAIRSRSRASGRQLSCRGAECMRAGEYLDRLFAQEGASR